MKYSGTIALTVAASIAAVAAYPYSALYILAKITVQFWSDRTLDWRTPIPQIYMSTAAESPRPACLGSPPGMDIQIWLRSGCRIRRSVTEGINEHGLAMNGLFC